RVSSPAATRLTTNQAIGCRRREALPPALSASGPAGVDGTDAEWPLTGSGLESGLQPCRFEVPRGTWAAFGGLKAVSSGRVTVDTVQRGGDDVPTFVNLDFLDLAPLCLGCVRVSVGQRCGQELVTPGVVPVCFVVRGPLLQCREIEEGQRPLADDP